MQLRFELKGLERFASLAHTQVFHKALGRTRTRLGTRFKKTTVREVRKTYNIRAKELKKHIRTKDYGDKWHFQVSSNSLNLANFSAKQTKKGVSVKVRKDRGRKVIQGAFLANDTGGRKRVFMRKSKFRLPIDAKHTLSLPQMFNKDIVEKGMKEVEVNFEREFVHNLEYYLVKIR